MVHVLVPVRLKFLVFLSKQNHGAGNQDRSSRKRRAQQSSLKYTVQIFSNLGFEPIYPPTVSRIFI